MGWLKQPRALALTVALVVQIAVLYGVSRQENEPRHAVLAGFPSSINGWTLAQEGVVENAIREALGANDLLSRTYGSPATTAPVNLFVAFFKSQRTGVVPHSPKYCLPAGGWVPSVSDIIPISIPGRAAPIRVNRYLVTKGDAKSVVLYWYQSHGRVIASEVNARMYLVSDAIRYNRTDTALVRVTVPVIGDSDAQATEAAVKFVQAVFEVLRPFASG